MTMSVLQAAEHLARRSNWTLSNLQLQKIIYLAHMFYMGENDAEPLVHGNFEAWAYGPVHPTLYQKAKVYGSGSVKSLDVRSGEPKKSEAIDIINEAYDDLKDSSPGKLINITHREGGAWDRNYVAGARHIIIPNDEILDEYRRFYK